MYEMHRTLRFRDPEEEARFLGGYFRTSLPYIRIALILGLGLFVVFGYLDQKIAYDQRHELWAIRYFILCPTALILLLLTAFSVFRRIMQPALATALLISGFGIVGMIWTAHTSDVQQYYVGVILILMFVFTFSRLRFVLALPVGLAIGFSYEIVAFPILDPGSVTFQGNTLFLFSAIVVGSFSSYQAERHIRREWVNRQLLRAEQEKLKAEQEKTSKLLLNILPAPVAERLKNGEELIVDKFENATILFADIVGFTEYSARVPPDQLVKLLAEVFSTIDVIATKYGLEKIKTIGDGYMVAGGLPLLRLDHAKAVAKMALETQHCIAQIPEVQKENMKLRIGINTGSVVAGVIGKLKFSYDMWGSAVNIASRMESNSEGGGILVSETTYQSLKDEFELEQRPEQHFRGIPEKMTTYWLKGRKRSIPENGARAV